MVTGMKEKIKNEQDVDKIVEQGLEALVDKLGLVGMVRFMLHINQGRGEQSDGTGNKRLTPATNKNLHNKKMNDKNKITKAKNKTKLKV
jgi:hypothetical protein